MADLTLDEVETAIEAIQTGGQSYAIDGMQYTAASLQSLVALREKLKREQDRTSNARPAFRGYNFTGMGY